MIKNMASYSELIEEFNNYEYYSDIKHQEFAIAYDRLNLGISDRLMDKMGRLSKKYGLIRKSITNVNSDFLVVLCDENDVSSADRHRILMAKVRTKGVFVIMVCPNRIMNEEHDASGIPDIIDVKKNLSGFPVAITIEKNFSANVEIYLKLIKQYVTLKNIRLAISSDIDILEKSVLELDRESNHDLWSNIYRGWNVQSIKKLVKLLVEHSNKIDIVLKQIEASYAEYASDCKNEMAEEKYHKEDVGDFAADLLFKYDAIQRKIRTQLENLRNSICMKDETYAYTIDSCLKKMNDKPQVSFVGNFSSGKTSYINWLLAMEGNKQLRTSGGHNTAILTFIKKGNPEKVVMKYKKKPDKFLWKLLEVEYETEFADIYTGENNAVVTRIDEVNRVIGYRYEDKRKRIVLKNNVDEILVQKNDILKYGIQLTGGAKKYVDISKENSNVALCKDEEYKEIINAITNNKLLNCKVIVSYVSKKNIKNRISASVKEFEIENVQDIISFLGRLRRLERKFEGNNISFEKVNSSGFWRGEKVAYFPNDIDYIFNSTIEGECQYEDKSENLNDRNWMKYCGTGKNEERVYTETPEGYLFAKQITYYLDKGFLNYSDIIDTPGLGSTSDEHDDITERYIRTNVSNLLVMLKIDKNGISRTKRKFIYEIAKIYEDSGRNKKNVFFVCNLWSKDYSSSDLKELEKICDRYYEDIQECDFYKENFYVIDIQKMQSGHHETEMFGKYQSDEVFKDRFIGHIANEGILQQIRDIDEDICNLFKTRQVYYNELITMIHADNSVKQQKVDMLNQGKKTVGLIDFKASFDDLFAKENDALDLLVSLSLEIASIDKRKEWIKFADSCLKHNSYDDLKMDDIAAIEMTCREIGENYYKDKIVDKYLLILKKLKRCLKDELYFEDQSPTCKNIDDAIKRAHNHRIGMSGFPFNDLRNRIANQRKNFEGIIHIFHNADISRKDARAISEFIEKQIEKCREENRENYDRIIQEFVMIKTAILSDIQLQIDNFSSNDNGEQKISEYNNYLVSLKSDQSRWERDISNTAQMREMRI